MLTTTDKTLQHPVIKAEEFYDALAPDYDLMTGFERRFISEKPFFRVLVEKYKIQSALDAGCGTGFHSLLLGRLGVRVTAVDVSGAMLAQLGRHAETQGVRIETVQASFEELTSGRIGAFDAVFCMGNTLAHILEPERLRAAIAAFHALLNPGGILFAQVLNYDRILLQRPAVLNVTESAQATYTRSYEYHDDLITFNIASQSRTDPQSASHLRTTLRPLMQQELLPLLQQTGFAPVQSFGGISMEPFVAAESKDLVILTQKVL